MAHTWELTSVEGLNYATSESRTCYFYSTDTRSGATCKAFGFDVGQPMASPPVHPAHRDIGLGRVERIYRFRSLSEITFAFEWAGARFIVEIDGKRDLKLRMWPLSGSPGVRNVLVVDGFEVAIDPRMTYEVGDGVQSYPNRRRPPQASLSMREALRQCVYGNTVREAGGALYTPVNRAWVKMLGSMFGQGDHFAGPVCFVWDAAFASVLAARVDVDLALSNLRVLLRQMEPSGMLRQLRVGDVLNNLSGAPVVTLAAQAIYEQSGAVEHLAELYPSLLAMNRWLRASRDHNGDGLLEWGYEESGKGTEIVGRWAPAYESGMENSPMWDDVPFDESRRCYASSSVGLSSLVAYDCELLAGMAAKLGRTDERDELLAAREKLARAIDEQLWDPQRRIYANRAWSGERSDEVSPTSFLPLLAGIPDERRAAALIAHLSDERWFGGTYRLPSVARGSRSFAPCGDYWRGRVWPPLNYLVLRGLERYDQRAAEQLRRDSRHLFLKEWVEHGHMHENYCADTGYGEAAEGVYYRSCPFYTWAGLLLL